MFKVCLGKQLRWETPLKPWLAANDLAFTVQQRVSFEVPLAAISNSNMAGKNEVALEFAPPPATERVNRPPDELMEMRFYIPQRIGKKRSGSNGAASDEDADDEDEEEEEDYDEEGNPISAAEAFHNAITTMAEIKEQAGDAIVTLPDVSVPTPRGRYDVELHADHLRLHGKTYDYKIPYKHIHRMFLLPKPDATFQQLIVSVSLIQNAQLWTDNMFASGWSGTSIATGTDEVPMAGHAVA